MKFLKPVIAIVAFVTFLTNLYNFPNNLRFLTTHLPSLITEHWIRLIICVVCLAAVLFSIWPYVGKHISRVLKSFYRSDKSMNKSLNISGNGNAVSFGENKGIIAGTYVNRPVQNFFYEQNRTSWIVTLLTIIGVLFSIVLTWVQIGKEIMNDDSKKVQINVPGNNNAISIGDNHGVIAGTYINQAIQPEYKVLDKKESENADGSRTMQLLVALTGNPSRVTLTLKSKDIVDASFRTDTNQPMMLQNFSSGPEVYQGTIVSPPGKLVVTLTTKANSPAELNIHF